MVNLKSIETLIDGSREFEIVSQRTNRFCPFEAVGMARQEIRHSNYLSYILEPTRPHGLGNVALSRLMKLVGGKMSSLAPYDLASARVFRELDNIDLLVEVPAAGDLQKGLVIAVEIKIDAGERPSQLDDYAERVRQRYPKSRWEHKLCFLTPDGRDGVTQGQAPWMSLSFTALLTAIDEDMDGTEVSGEGVALFKHYLTMMKRHDIVSGDSDPELAQAVQDAWRKHKEALEYLIRHRPDPFGPLMADLTENQAKFANDIREGGAFAPDESYTRYRRFGLIDLARRHPELLTSDAGWISSGAHIVLELTHENGHFMASFAVGPMGSDNGSVRSKLLAELLKTIGQSQQRNPKGVKHFWRQGILSADELLESDDMLGLLTERTKAFVDEHYCDVETAVGAVFASGD